MRYLNYKSHISEFSVNLAFPAMYKCIGSSLLEIRQ